jgi:hypothetical protein
MPHHEAPSDRPGSSSAAPKTELLFAGISLALGLAYVLAGIAG